MKDNEIIKALECCINGQCATCVRLDNPLPCVLCKENLMRYALDLINRQKAEIERLKEKLNHSIGVDNTKENGYFPFD